GGETNTVHLVTAKGGEDWPELGKSEVGKRLAARIAEALKGKAAWSSRFSAWRRACRLLATRPAGVPASAFWLPRSANWRPARGRPSHAASPSRCRKASKRRSAPDPAWR